MNKNLNWDFEMTASHANRQYFFLQFDSSCSLNVIPPLLLMIAICQVNNIWGVEGLAIYNVLTKHVLIFLSLLWSYDHRDHLTYHETNAFKWREYNLNKIICFMLLRFMIRLFDIEYNKFNIIWRYTKFDIFGIRQHFISKAM